MQGQTIILCGPTQRDFAKKLVDKAPDNAVLNIREAARTNDQNSKFWAMLSDVSRSKPEGRKHTPEVWKALVMHACGHATQFEIGLNGEPFPVGFRSSRLSKSQMADLITWVQQYGDEHGVVWTEPDTAPTPPPMTGAKAGAGHSSRPVPASYAESKGM